MQLSESLTHRQRSQNRIFLIINILLNGKLLYSIQALKSVAW